MRAIGLYWVLSCLLTALFVQQSNTGSVLTWQPQIEWFVDCYHSEWNNLISEHWTRGVGECRTLTWYSSLWVISPGQKPWSKQLLMQVFSLPKGNKIKGAFSAQHLLLTNTGCAAHSIRGNDRSYSSLSVPSPLRILVWTRFCPDKPSWEDVCEGIKVPSTWEPLAALWPLSLGIFLHLSGRAAYLPFMQNLHNEADAGLIHSLSPGLLLRAPTLPEDAVHWFQL